VFVCVRERERERERVCGWVGMWVWLLVVVTGEIPKPYQNNDKNTNK
jgi:hypothetical protein